MSELSSRWTDETARKRHESAIAGCMSCNKFRGETRTLGESNQSNSMQRDSSAGHALYDFFEQTQRRAKPRLILLNRREKGIWVPGVPRGFRSKICQFGQIEFIRKTHDIRCRSAPAVKKHDCTSRGIQRSSALENRLVTMRVIR